MAERDGAVGAPDVGREVHEILVALPALADGRARRPVSWPVVIKAEPQVDCVSVELLSDRELVTITDVSRDIRCSPDVVPVMLPSHLESDDMGVTQDAHLRTELCLMSFEDSASVPMSLPVEANTETQVDVRWEPTLVVVPSNEVTGITGEAQVQTDVGPVMSEDSAMEPMSLPVEANTETQVDVRWESTLVVVPLSEVTGVTGEAQLQTHECPVMSEDSAMEPMSFPVVANTESQVEVGWEATSMMAPSSCGGGRLVGWFDTKSDCWVADEIMLDMEMSPIISGQSAAVPAFLATKSDVFSLAVLAGGGGGRWCGSPPGRGRDSHIASVYPAGCWERTYNGF